MFKDYNKIVLYDTETTGLDFEKDQIIEIAFLIMERQDGRLIATKKYDKFIKLNKLDKLPEKIVELTHITDEMLKEYGMEEKEVAKEFAAATHCEQGKVLLVAHNAQFDLNMTFQMLKRQFGQSEALEILQGCDHLDTQTVLKDRKEFPHKLETAIEYYQLSDKCQNSHRAIDDVMALTYVTNAMAQERDDLDEYINIFGYNPKYKVDGLPFHFIHYAKQFFNKGIVNENRILPRTITC